MGTTLTPEALLVYVAQDRRIAELLADLCYAAEQKTVAVVQLIDQQPIFKTHADGSEQLVEPFPYGRALIDDLTDVSRLTGLYNELRQALRPIDPNAVRHAAFIANQLVNELYDLERSLEEHVGALTGATATDG